MPRRGGQRREAIAGHVRSACEPASCRTRSGAARSRQSSLSCSRDRTVFATRVRRVAWLRIRHTWNRDGSLPVAARYSSITSSFAFAIAVDRCENSSSNRGGMPAISHFRFRAATPFASPNSARASCESDSPRACRKRA